MSSRERGDPRPLLLEKPVETWFALREVEKFAKSFYPFRGVSRNDRERWYFATMSQQENSLYVSRASPCLPSSLLYINYSPFARRHFSK